MGQLDGDDGRAVGADGGDGDGAMDRGNAVDLFAVLSCWKAMAPRTGVRIMPGP